MDMILAECVLMMPMALANLRHGVGEKDGCGINLLQLCA
jgi:hypothetical protein